MPPAFFSTSNPLRYSRRQLKTWLALTVCRCATRATDAPGSNVSSTILRLSATERRRRGNALLTTTRSEASIYPPMWTLTEVSTSGHRPHLPPTSSRRFIQDAYFLRLVGRVLSHSASPRASACRLASTGGRAQTQKPSATSQQVRSAVLGAPETALAPLVRGLGDRQAANRSEVASSGVSTVLAVSLTSS